MSVGLSQVNFDAQALEDEEEAAFEKEDQEREKELLELISNELDDDLLDDDNTSFSSHDFRSSSRSQDTPNSGFPPDSSPPQWNGHGQYGLSGGNDAAAFPQYPARIPGGFERPPLVTPKGFHLLKGNTSENRQDQIHGKNPNYEYHDEDSIQLNQNPNEFQQQQNDEHDPHARMTDYHHHGNYGAGINNIAFRNYKETGHPSAFQSYVPQERFEGRQDSSESEEGENEDVKNVIGGYEGAYIDDSDHEDHHTRQHREEHYDPVGQRKTYEYVDDSHQGNYGMENTKNERHLEHIGLGEQGIGEQRVKYLKRQLPTDHHGDGISEDHVIRDTQTHSSNSQLEILYRARGRKIEELSQQLEEKEEEFGKQIRMLNHQLALVKGEHAGMATSLEQAQKIIVDNKNEINELKSKLTSAIQERDTVQQDKEEAEQKLHVAESAVESLNQQVVELSRSESLRRAKEQNENLLDSIRKKHQDETLKLRQKLDENAVNLEWKTEEANRLRDELAKSRRETDSARLDRAETINQLTKSLEESQNQCRQLLHKAASGATEEVVQLRVQMQEALNAQSRAENQCKTLQAELTDVKEQLLSYENALKLGVGRNDLQDPLIRDLNRENWKTPGTSTQDETEASVLALRTELENCIAKNMKTRRDLEAERHLMTERLKEEEERSQKMELIAQEREKQTLELAQKLEQLQHREYSPDHEEYQIAFREMEEMKQGFLEFEQKLRDAEESNEQLQGENAGLRRQMAEMVAEFDEDKRISIEKCRNSVLQLHDDSSKLLREKMQEEHKEQMDAVRKELEATSEELIRVKECYVQLCQETRELEQKIRDEHSTETQKNEPEAMQQLRHSLEEEQAAALEKIKRELSTQKQSEIEAAVEQQVSKIREDIHKEQKEKTNKAINEALFAARKNWEQETNDEAMKNWSIEKEREFEKRLKSKMEEARSLWQMEHQTGIQKAIEEARVEWEMKYTESSTQDTERAVEVALSQARADWLKHEEELRQREIEQAVEVAITNAVAEARQKWDKEAQVKEVTGQAQIMKERAKWKKEEEEQREKSVETAVAIAEIKWLEQEQVKRSQAVEEALSAVRETWQQEKQRDIELAIENTKCELETLLEKERQASVEKATKEVEAQLKEENEEAVRMAVEQAKLDWLRNRDDNNNSTPQNVDLESMKDELLKEFEQYKEMEIRQAVDEERTLWQEESEEQKQAAVNEAIHYLEEQYSKGLEEFKHKELREALSDAREQWEREEAREREEHVQKRVSAVRENWQKDQLQFTQAEIDRALKTAREAWAANHQEELEEKLLQATEHAHREMEDRLADEKKKIAEFVKRATEKQFEKEKLHFENELEESKKQIAELERDLQRLIQSADSELEERLSCIREELAAEHDGKVEHAIEEAKKHWEEEQEEERIQLEEQYQQKIKLTVESARKEWNKEHEDTVKMACDEAVKKQQKLWSNERHSNQSVVSRLRDDVQKMKKEHVVALEKLRKDLLQEKVKTKYNHSRRDSRDYSTQTPAESENDTSFGSIDQMTAAQGLHELRQHYLDTVAKIREDVVDHINQTKANAAKKIRSEVLKERHTTAKKLRKYYLQCLKQLLEEDRTALSKNGTTSSDAIKLKRMANALKIPDSAEKTEQHQKQEEETTGGTPLGNKPTHYNKVKSSQPVNEHGCSKNYLTSEITPQSKPRDCGISDGNVTNSSDSSLRDTDGYDFKSNERVSDVNTRQKTLNRVLKSKIGSRPNAYSPEGDSDPAVLGPRRAEKIASLTNGTTCKPVNEHIVDRGRLIRGDRTLGKEPPNTDNSLRRGANEPCDIEHIATQDQEENRAVSIREQRGWGTGRVTAPSPAFSAVSYESEHYSELPTVITVTPKKNIDSSPSVSARPTRNTRGQYALSSAQNEHVTTPVLHNFRDKNSTAARGVRLKPKDKSLTTSPLPTKPLFATNAITGKPK